MTPDPATPRNNCPDCGHANPPGRTSCERCNFPFELPAGAPAADEQPAVPAGAEEPPVATGESGEPGAPSSVPPPYVPLRRPARRPPRGMAPEALSLWLLFGGIAAIGVIWVALQTNLDRARAPVEGAQPQQQQRVDELLTRLETDSTDVDAHIALADVLYDTGNWPDAIVHYKAAVRRDSTRISAIVDLGVCYYNLGHGGEAERLFRLALTKEPTQPVALFNLGILHERREEYELANQLYHRALQSNPPDDMRAAIVAAMQRIQQETGAQAPALPESRGGP